MKFFLPITIEQMLSQFNINFCGSPLATLYVFLSLLMLIVGYFVYFTNLVPSIVVRLFKYGRANYTNAVEERTTQMVKSLEVPKSWFGHFYLWAGLFQGIVFYTIIQTYSIDSKSGVENGQEENWLSKILAFVAGSNRQCTGDATTTVVVAFLFLFHLIRRFVETIFVSIFSGSKMNVVHYFLGYLHYTCASLSLVSQSPGFSSERDYLIDILSISKPQMIGICLFIYGNYQQFLAHKGFADLRKTKDPKAVKHEYKIPRGGLFKKVSCPNYFAEILIYTSLVMITGFSNSALNWCLIWVASNQIMAGIMNHLWYKEKFGNQYPQSRKAIIPYIL